MGTPWIAVVDAEQGNLGSVANMVKAVGKQALVTSEHEQLRQADYLILPGVGAFDKFMASLRRLDLLNVLNELVLERGVPILGTCLGMQVFMEESDEGAGPGLGWIKGPNRTFRHFPLQPQTSANALECGRRGPQGIVVSRDE